LSARLGFGEKLSVIRDNLFEYLHAVIHILNVAGKIFKKKKLFHIEIADEKEKVHFLLSTLPLCSYQNN